ncbi:MAG TPA: SDR family oxidoreductase [Acidimicrobiales bacterium]|nr:SDR family oxidoreductase [Acidimicrobiales bacterium]
MEQQTGPFGPVGPAGGPLDFSGLVVVVTGGTRGVGLGISNAFLAAGADVVVCGRMAPPAGELPSAAGRTASFVAADVRHADEAKAVVTAAVDRHGRLDVLVNNAGGSPEAEAAEASPRFVAAIVGLNLLAPMYCAQRANAVMQTQDSGGSIVNIGSVSGLRPSPGTAAYGAAKAGLLNLTRSLAVEWAPKVRVNCVIPGMIKTEAAHDHYGGELGIQAVAQTVPMRRLGTPADVAGVCLFLASPLAGYVTGAGVEVHGGGERPAYRAAVQSASGTDLGHDPRP